MNEATVQTLFSGAADEKSKRLVARLALADCDIDNTFELIAAVYRQALRDAWRGDVGATEFLDMTTPDWKELSAHHLPNTQKAARGGATHKSDV